MREGCVTCRHTPEVWFVCMAHWQMDFHLWEHEMLGQWGVL